MHLRDGVDETLDPEGVVLPASAVAGAALLAARDCIAADVRGGRIELKYRIDVYDKEGALIYTMPFADAVEIVPAWMFASHHCGHAAWVTAT
jgi:hypothetical protein